MGRPVYPHELSDADFSWLINSYKENNPSAAVVESSCLPIVLIRDCVPQVREQLPPPPVDMTDAEIADLKEGD